MRFGSLTGRYARHQPERQAAAFRRQAGGGQRQAYERGGSKALLVEKIEAEK